MTTPMLLGALVVLTGLVLVVTRSRSALKILLRQSGSPWFASKHRSGQTDMVRARLQDLHQTPKAARPLLTSAQITGSNARISR
ncbi:MAG TPA: hypothetical protein VGS97_06430 [Actinocrinis sp.]|uniref:hypothetical protein n=1 Tax=Actinocrinis sp. TaxID=1920516 RepID=UPI002DDD26DF|nr:hypothetical protein [Actinocrinis sp.]HEV2343708.1 hypothetical protein [Actinocrinis sp.]